VARARSTPWCKGPRTEAGADGTFSLLVAPADTLLWRVIGFRPVRVVAPATEQLLRIPLVPATAPPR
jgi:hypothetical protein